MSGTPPESTEQVDELLELARGHLGRGDLRGAEEILRGRVGLLPRGRQRALAHLLLGEATDGDAEEAELDRAIAEAKDDDDLYGIALCRKAALLATFRVQRIIEAVELAREAQTFTEGTAEEGRGQLALGWALLLRGQPIDYPRRGFDPPPGEGLFEAAVDRPIGIQKAFRGNLEEAREIMLRLRRLAEERGDARSAMGSSIQLCELGLRRGDVIGSALYLDEVDRWMGIDEMRMVCARIRAVTAALKGSPDEVEKWAGLVLDESVSTFRPKWDYLEAKRAVGISYIYQDDYPAAASCLDEVWQHCRREGVDDPGAFPVAGDLVEALVESDQHARAAAVAEALGRLSRDQDHPWGLATTRRAEATIQMAGGDGGSAGEELLQAASDYGRLGLEFEQARCLLYLGRVEHRHSEQAADIFRRLGCEGWAAKAG